MKNFVQFFKLPAFVALLLLSICITRERAYAQDEYQFHELDSQLRVVYGGMCYDTTGPLFLYDQATHSLDSIYFTDFNPDTLVREYWFTIYDEIRRSAYDTNTIPQPMDSVYVHGMQWEQDTMVMNFLAYNQNRIIDTMIDAGYYDIDTINNTITDINPCEVDPYYVQRVFAACPVELLLPSMQTTYRIDTAFFFHDKFNDIFDSTWTVKIDFGDGAGWQTYMPGVLGTPKFYNADYTGNTSGYAYITTQIWAGPIMKMSSVATIGVPLGAAAKIKPDNVVPFPGMTVGFYNPCSESGGPLKKVLIYLEGWDPGDMFPGSDRKVDKIYTEQISGTGIDNLRNFGYTIAVVDWLDSRIDIKDNALFFEGFLDWLKCQQMANQDDTGTHEQFVIIAESMGGLVARYALCDMEDKAAHNLLGGCLPQKIHNTRELLTFDTPNDGANMPMAFQLVYRDIGKYLLGAGNITQRICGSSLNLLLDSKAAKQMLLYHVDTKSGSSYSEHSDRTAFKSDLAAIGNYPQYCKLMALSNGSMHGHGQTRFYDSTERVPNDYFLNYSFDLQGRMFGIDFPVMEQRLKLQSSPNGSGQLVELNRTTYHPVLHLHIKIKTRWPWPPKITWAPKIEFDPSSSMGITHNASGMEPYDVISGGNQNFNSQIAKNNGSTDLTTRMMGTFFGFNQPDYDPTTHTWVTTSSAYIGKHNQFGSAMVADLYSDGLSFCFVPTFSALDYSLPSNNYWYDIASDNASNNMGRTPFDVIMGQIVDNSEGMYRFNLDHLSERNPQLKSIYDDSITYFNPQEYEACGDDNPHIPQHVIEREIGDDTLLVENRTTHWTCLYDAEKFVGVNFRSPYYRYPTSTGSHWVLPGIFSKENGYTIATGKTYFAATGYNCAVNPSIPLSGSYSFENIDWVKCCNPDYEFQHLGVYTNKATIKEFKVIPNPVITSDVIFEFSAVKDENSRLEVYDLTGRRIVNQSFVVSKESANYRYHLTLGDWPSGTYYVVLKNGNEQYKAKLVKE